MKDTLIKKLTSRKFIVTVITALSGIITLIIGENETVQIIAGAAMTIVPTIVYCLMEGTIDAKSIKTITEVTADTAEKMGADEKTVETIGQIGAVYEVIAETENTDE